MSKKLFTIPAGKNILDLSNALKTIVQKVGDPNITLYLDDCYYGMDFFLDDGIPVISVYEDKEENRETSKIIITHYIKLEAIYPKKS